jgi:hypothetical protein
MTVGLQCGGGSLAVVLAAEQPAELHQLVAIERHHNCRQPPSIVVHALSSHLTKKPGAQGLKGYNSPRAPNRATRAWR